MRREHWSIHNPITFLSSLVVPQTPPSFVKLKRIASSLRMGAVSSVPIRLHVPELMNAALPRAVMAATADAVSCEPGAITGVPFSEAFREMPGSRRPTTVPGSTISAGSRDGRPSCSSKSTAHVRVTGFMNCVVLASVYSQTALPVIQ